MLAWLTILGRPQPRPRRLDLGLGLGLGLGLRLAPRLPFSVWNPRFARCGRFAPAAPLRTENSHSMTAVFVHSLLNLAHMRENLVN